MWFCLGKDSLDLGCDEVWAFRGTAKENWASRNQSRREGPQWAEMTDPHYKEVGLYKNDTLQM